jgi:hypothetical protein
LIASSEKILIGTGFIKLLLLMLSSSSLMGLSLLFEAETFFGSGDPLNFQQTGDFLIDRFG